jgi:hypothetical protein
VDFDIGFAADHVRGKPKMDIQPDTGVQQPVFGTRLGPRHQERKLEYSQTTREKERKRAYDTLYRERKYRQSGTRAVQRSVLVSDGNLRGGDWVTDTESS